MGPQKEKKERKTCFALNLTAYSSGSRYGKKNFMDRSPILHCPYNRPDFTVYRAEAKNATLYNP